MRLGSVVIDVALALVIAVAAGRMAYLHVAARVTPDPSDADAARLVESLLAPYREDLLQPCLGRFGFMADPAALTALSEWKDMTAGRSAAFPCSALSGVAIVPVHYSFWLQQHLHRAMSWVFVRTGPRPAGLAWFQAGMYAAVIGLLFGVFRLGMGRVVAALMMVPLALSPRHLEMALAPIEYAKAPFFAGCLLGIGALVAVPMRRRFAWGVAAATGTVVGLGFGFKPDVLVYAAFGAAALVLFPQPSARRHRDGLVTAAVFVSAVLVAGLPVLQAHFGGPQRSLLPVQVLGGMSPGFMEQYARPALYDYGVMFDDDYVTAQINSFNQRINGSPEFGLFFTSTLQQGANDLMLLTVRTFPADFLMRTFAAVLQVCQFVPAGALIVLGVWVGLCRSDRRVALFVLFTVVCMVGYVSLVFAPKHYFHLEFVPWWFAGVAVSAAARRWTRSRAEASGRSEWRSWRSAAITAAMAFLLAGSALAILRLYQSHQVAGLVDAYLRTDQLEPIGIHVSGTSASATMITADGVALPVSDPAPAEDGALAPVFDSPVVATHYLALRVECMAARVGEIGAIYRRPLRWRHPFAVACERPQQRWTVMWPVYQHLPYQAFTGFELAADTPLRVAAIDRVRDVTRYPLLVRMRLPDDWRDRSLTQRLDPTAVSPFRVRPLQAALTLPAPPLPPPAAHWDPPFVRPPAPLAAAAPSLASWAPVAGVSVSPVGEGVLVEGDATPFGYQIVSPPIGVTPHSRLVVRVYGDVEQGRAAFGILDGSGMRWLMPAVWGRSDFVTTTGDNDHVVMVFANVRQPSDGIVTSRFRVRSVSYELQNSRIDQIRRVFWPVAE